jgi:hypothetical protein
MGELYGELAGSMMPLRSQLSTCSRMTDMWADGIGNCFLKTGLSSVSTILWVSKLHAPKSNLSREMTSWNSRKELAQLVRPERREMGHRRLDGVPDGLRERPRRRARPRRAETFPLEACRDGQDRAPGHLDGLVRGVDEVNLGPAVLALAMTGQSWIVEMKSMSGGGPTPPSRGRPSSGDSGLGEENGCGHYATM